MQISRSRSPLFRFTSFWIRDLSTETKIGVCAFFWLTVLSLLFSLIASLMFIISWGLGWLIAIRGWKNLDEVNGPRVTFDYDNWPEYRYHRIWPITILVPVTIVLGLSWLVVVYWQAITNFFTEQYVQISLVFVAAVAFAVWLTSKLQHTATFELIGEMAKATKNRVCPIIEIVD